MKEWLISGWLHLILGFVIGWIVFEKPQWAKDLWDKIKSKVGL